jgi:hypothetical protein
LNLNPGPDNNPDVDWQQIESLVRHLRIPGFVGDSAALRTVSVGGLADANEARAPSVTLDDAMKSAISRSLHAARGDRAKAARSRGISRPSICRKNGSLRIAMIGRTRAL